MKRQKSRESNFSLPKDKLPECNLFTLFLRKQTQASSELNFDRKKIVNKEKNKTPTQVNRKQINAPKSIQHQSMSSITPERNASKKKQIVYSNMKNFKKTPYHHLSVNIIDTVETSDSNSKSFQKMSFQKSRKPSLTIKDLNQSQLNQPIINTVTQRSQASSQCKTRKSSISADLAHRHTQRSSFIQGINCINNVNLIQSRTTRTEQSQERSSSQFKAKKMPNFQVPFIVYKSNKPLTTFKEFNLVTRQRSSSGQHTKNTNEVQINHSSNHTSIKKNQNTSIQVSGKENKDQNAFLQIARPQLSLSKSSNRTYLSENINYLNMQNYINTQQQEYEEQNNEYQKFSQNSHTQSQSQQQQHQSNNSYRTQVSNRINHSNQSSSIKDNQFFRQNVKQQQQNGRQFF